jgi:hypothetical protein
VELLPKLKDEERYASARMNRRGDNAIASIVLAAGKFAAFLTRVAAA